MSKFKKGGKRKTPAVSTAALPDIVFMLLFFFMVATTAKDEDAIVQVTVPGATQTGKIEDKSLVAYINFGKPNPDLQKEYGENDRMQLNDAIKEFSDIPQFIEEKRASIKKQAPTPELGQKLVRKMEVCLKIDQNSKNGSIDDIKIELRKMNALLINYIVNDQGE